ncbi:aldo/keto reductase [Microbacterium pseudoresistens]|uniref:Aryl-alcohol dehydrogenase-like predicted oxidoreductase n=1 Tax=Microbacterium pseudoresistens TaxID=640634 RepID=A0A7Y9JLQ4_9MICO|nr:aryl-alcohol dehydrogenase-like predicted oxidoreductase [Microbacterium pseudoresistens]
MTTASLTDTVHLGDGLRVSPQGYGAMSLSDAYGVVDDATAYATLVHAVDRGVTFIDSANIYGSGRSERIISGLLRTRRDEVQLVSKAGIVPGSGSAGRRELRGDRAHIREQIDLSLGRLGTDRLDLYYLHRVDPEVPIEDSIGTLAELVQEGKVHHIGVSEPTGDELRRAHAVHPIAAVQSEWSVLSRDVEAHVVPTAAELGIGVVPYAPVGRKWLTGRFDPAEVGEGDVRRSFPRFAPEALAANAPLLAEHRALAEEAGLSPAQLALAWLVAKGREYGATVVPIPGSRRAAHVDDNLGAVGVELESAIVARLDALAEQVVGARTRDKRTSLHREQGVRRDARRRQIESRG